MSKNTCAWVLSALAVISVIKGDMISPSIFISTAILIIALKDKD